jgi:hypothetical protein
MFTFCIRPRRTRRKPVEKRPYIFACHLIEPRNSVAFDQKPKERRAAPIMHGSWAVRVSMTAPQLKQTLRRFSC